MNIKKIFKGKESIEIFKNLGLIIEQFQKIYNHSWRKHEPKNLDWKKDEIRNCLIQEINRNELMSKTHKKVCRVLNYIEHSIRVNTAITGCVSISAFASLVGISIGITSSAVGVRICVITAGIKKNKSIN